MPQNLPDTITIGSYQEQYVYDPDGHRLYRRHPINGQWYVTIYLDDGLVEVDYPNGPNYPSRAYYQFDGQTVAQSSKSAPTSPRTLTWLHTDQLGSVAVTSNASGGRVSTQEYDPWGAVRSGGAPETTVNFTGQRLDSNGDGTGTGLLYYGARYYDPVLGRFISPDSIVPGGSNALTVDFYQTQAVRMGGGGPANPQALNRYAYVLNDPVTRVDPGGHCDGFLLESVRLGAFGGIGCGAGGGDRGPYYAPGGVGDGGGNGSGGAADPAAGDAVPPADGAPEGAQDAPPTQPDATDRGETDPNAEMKDADEYLPPEYRPMVRFARAAAYDDPRVGSEAKYWYANSKADIKGPNELSDDYVKREYPGKTNVVRYYVTFTDSATGARPDRYPTWSVDVDEATGEPLHAHPSSGP